MSAKEEKMCRIITRDIFVFVLLVIFIFYFFFLLVIFSLLGLPTPSGECLFWPVTVLNLNSLVFSSLVLLANKIILLAFKRKIKSISRS